MTFTGLIGPPGFFVTPDARTPESGGNGARQGTLLRPFRRFYPVVSRQAKALITDGKPDRNQPGEKPPGARNGSYAKRYVGRW